MKTDFLQIRINPDEKKLWKEAAANEGVSVTELLSTLMHHHLGIPAKK